MHRPVPTVCDHTCDHVINSVLLEYNLQHWWCLAATNVSQPMTSVYAGWH